MKSIGGVVLITLFAVLASSEQIKDLSQLVGKKVVLQRLALCEPGTYHATVAYAGKPAVVLSVKPSNVLLYPVSQSVLNQMTPEARAILEDQQKAATVIVQVEDGKKFDTCAPVGPARISEYLELAEGETLAAPSPYVLAARPSAESASGTPSVETSTEMLSDGEVQSALRGVGKDHWVQIKDQGLWAASGATGTIPHIILFTPEAIISARNENAKRQFLSYTPSQEERRKSLTVFAQGYIGKTYQEGCESITRVVLLSSPSGNVVEEAYLSESGTEAWANAFGATNQCGWLRAKFSLAAVQKVRSAAKDGEFYVAVFAGNTNTKTYKIKHKHQAKLRFE